MEEPLLFLTSNSSAVPKGRNARKQARSRFVQQSRRHGSIYGELNTFQLSGVAANTLSKSVGVNESHFASKHPHRRSPARPQSAEEQGIPAVIEPPLDYPSLHIVCLRQPLAEATARLRLLLAEFCKADSSVCREVLRCRPWTRADFALSMLEVTPALASASAYLEYRLTRKMESQSQDPDGLGKYSLALVHLREALRNSDKRMHPSTLAANHILTLCTMFDFGRNSEWAKHVEGLVSVIKFQNEHCDDVSSRYFQSHAGPVMMQAFLTQQKQAILDQPWPQFLRAAGQKSHIPPEDALEFAESAELMLMNPQATTIEPVAKSIDYSLLSGKAHTIRSCIKERLLREMHSGPPLAWRCVGRELYDERLAVILSLDDFISTFGHATTDLASLHADSRILCQQVMDADLPIGPNRP